MSTFGLSEKDLQYVRDLVKKRVNFQKENELTDYSPITNPKRYYAELNNRVNAIKKMAHDENLSPIFITVTLPSEYHPSSKQYNGTNTREQNRKLQSIWRSIQNNRIFRNQKKYYIKVVEPMKSGVPHFHAILYLPYDVHSKFKQSFDRLMKSQNILQYDFKNDLSFKFDEPSKDSRHKHKHGYDNETGAIAYILKYMSKTFSKNPDEIDYIQAWYIKHKIRRVSLSRSTMPLKFFRKIHHHKKFRNLYIVTKNFKKGFFDISDHAITGVCHDEENGFYDELLFTKNTKTPKKSFDRKELLISMRKAKRDLFIPVHFVDQGGFIHKQTLNTTSMSISEPSRILTPHYMSDSYLESYIKELKILSHIPYNDVKLKIAQDEYYRRFGITL